MKEQLKECRVILTWDCNLECEYCCNKYPEIKSSFKPLTDPGILEQYDIVKISGGEPTLYDNDLYALMGWVRSDTKMYLYTNGNTIHPLIKFYEMGGWGVNYSPHSGINFELVREVCGHGFPLRVRLQKGEYSGKDFSLLRNHGCKVDLWAIGECDTVTEDRWDGSKTIF